MERAIGLCLVLALVGCNAAVTRLPSLHTQPPEAEAKSYTWHDPFPDEVAGPDTYTRPRTFTDPRTESMKNYMRRNFNAAHGFPQPAFGWNPMGSRMSASDPYQPVWHTEVVAAPNSAIPMSQQ